MLVAHAVNKRTGNEEIVVSCGGDNYKFTSSGHHHWNHRRCSKVSSWRWINKGWLSVSYIYKSASINPGYIKEVRDETILKILFHYRTYLESCGIRNFAEIGDVIQSS